MGNGSFRQNLITSVAALMCMVTFTPFAFADADYVSPEKFVIQRLKSAGIPDTFIDKLRLSFEPEGRDRLIELMALGFLAKADYSGHFSQKGIESCHALMKAYKKVFERAEAEYGVPREVIAALMWVETRHGKNTGTFAPMNVFYSVMMGEHPDTHPALMERLKKKLGQEPDVETVQKATERTKKKADWALEQVQALVKIDHDFPGWIDHLKTSYAGAFGYPQFLPSSYLTWAVSGDPTPGVRPDLFTMRDAILSVANYLKTNGWQTASFEARRAALFHYNRSEDYGNIIQKIARAVRPEGELARAPAGKVSPIESKASGVK
jgi:membrane-bound lytic murein transglycosylase B